MLFSALVVQCANGRFVRRLEARRYFPRAGRSGGFTRGFQPQSRRNLHRRGRQCSTKLCCRCCCLHEEKLAESLCEKRPWFKPFSCRFDFSVLILYHSCVSC